MPKTDPGAARPRILVGATCFADAEAALSLSAELARQLGAELHGLLVQDEAILKAASRPRAFAVSYSGARRSAITPAALLKAFQADARQFEQRLLRTAAAIGLGANFTSAPGRLLETVQQSARAGDVAVFGFKRTVRSGGSLVVILGSQGEVPEFAADLAARLHTRLTLLVPAARRRGIGQSMAAHAGPAGRILAYSDAAEILGWLDQLSAAAVIAAAAPDELPPLPRLVDAARCPVAVPVPRQG